MVSTVQSKACAPINLNMLSWLIRVKWTLRSSGWTSVLLKEAAMYLFFASCLPLLTIIMTIGEIEEDLERSEETTERDEQHHHLTVPGWILHQNKDVLCNCIVSLFKKCVSLSFTYEIYTFGSVFSQWISYKACEIHTRMLMTGLYWLMISLGPSPRAQQMRQNPNINSSTYPVLNCLNVYWWTMANWLRGSLWNERQTFNWTFSST